MNFIKRTAIAVAALLMLPQPCIAAQYPFEEFEASVYPRLERLADLCEENGMDVSYENSIIEIISDNISYGKEIYEIDKSKAHYVRESITRLSKEVEDNFNAYLKKEKQPKETVKFTNGDVSIDGHSFVGNTTKGERPVFFVGYNNVLDDFDKLERYGMNFAQIELGPHNVFTKPEQSAWKYTGTMDDTVKFFINENESYAGKSCLEINNTSGKSLVLYQDITVKPGSYSLKYYAKGINVEGGGIQYGTPSSVTTVKSFTDLTNEWKSYSYTFTARTTQTIRVAIDASAVIGRVLIDDMSIRRSGTEYFTNGDFERDFSYEVHADEPGKGIGVNYTFDPSRYYDVIEPAFDKAAEQGIKLDFIVSPHYFPNFIIDQGNIRITWNDSSFGSMLKFDIFSELGRRTIEEFLEFIVPKIAEKEALFSICLSNEPQYQIAYIDGFFEKYPDIKEKWVTFLTDRYSSIDELNQAYGKSYTSFSDVEMSLSNKTAQFYDTTIFNTKMFSEWHAWLAQTVKKYAPDVPVYTKQMQSYCMIDGMSPEMAADDGYSDLGGNDAYNLYYTGESLNGKLSWYEFVGSLSGAPVINSENHLLWDTNPKLSISPNRKEVGRHVYADLWQGAIHGRSATTVWALEKSMSESSIYYNNFGTRPDALAAVTRATYDLNRLSDLVYEFNNDTASVGILYSEASSFYEGGYAGSLTSTFNDINLAGHKVAFISEKQLLGDIEHKIILIPEYTNYVNEGTIDALNTFMENGGSVISFSSNLMYNTKKQQNVKSLNSQATLITSDIKGACISKLESMGLDNVVFYQGESRLTGVDWKTVEKNGRTYVNVCNNTYTDKKASLEIDGEIPEYVKDLISGEYVNPAEITIKTYEPLLLEIGEKSDSFIQSISHTAQNNSCVFLWQNNDMGAEKQFELKNEEGEAVYTQKLVNGEEQLEVTGLTSGCEYTATFSNQTQEKKVKFRTKRENSTSTLLKGWHLEYRGLDEYSFEEGDFAVVSNEAHGGNSSLKLTMYDARQSGVYFQLWRDVFLNAGTTYRYNIWYKTDGYGMEHGDSYLLAFVNDRQYENEEIIRQYNGTISGEWKKAEGQWHCMEFDFTPTVSKGYRFSMIIDCGGTIWIDDITIHATSDGAITGDSLFQKTSSSVGGDFEDDSFVTIPEQISGVESVYMGQNELKFSWTPSDDIKKVNVYRNENGTEVLVSSTLENEISLKTGPYETWEYGLRAVDANENESIPLYLSDTNMGNVSPVEFEYDGEKAQYLKAGTVKASGYAYENAKLYVALYNKGKLEAVNTASGTGRIQTEINVSEDELENKKLVAFFWNGLTPLRKIGTLFPDEQ